MTSEELVSCLRDVCEGNDRGFVDRRVQELFANLGATCVSVNALQQVQALADTVATFCETRAIGPDRLLLLHGFIAACRGFIEAEQEKIRHQVYRDFPDIHQYSERMTGGLRLGGMPKPLIP